MYSCIVYYPQVCLWLSFSSHVVLFLLKTVTQNHSHDVVSWNMDSSPMWIKIRSTAGNLNTLKENTQVLVVSSIVRRMWVMLSVHKVGHPRNLEQKCKWTHVGWSKYFLFHVSSSPVSPHTSQLFLLKCREWYQRQVLSRSEITQRTVIQID